MFTIIYIIYIIDNIFLFHGYWSKDLFLWMDDFLRHFCLSNFRKRRLRRKRFAVFFET
jgi:hypothetical protein